VGSIKTGAEVAKGREKGKSQGGGPQHNYGGVRRQRRRENSAKIERKWKPLRKIGKFTDKGHNKGHHRVCGGGAGNGKVLAGKKKSFGTDWEMQGGRMVDSETGTKKKDVPANESLEHCGAREVTLWPGSCK